MKLLENLLILLLQLGGAILIGVGLTMIWFPLGWIYSGVVAFILGHMMYLDAKTEESKT